MNLVFKKYYVPELICKQKPSSQSTEDKKVKLSQKITSNIKIKDNLVNVALHYATDENKYIDVKVTLVGIFELKLKNTETLSENDVDKIKAIKATAVSVLFPYLRQTITSLTQLNGDLVPVILPMYNIAKLLDNSEQ